MDDDIKLPSSLKILNILPFNIAILDNEGTILDTNKKWQQFAKDNNYKLHPETKGINYLEVTGKDDSDSAKKVLKGLKELINGKKEIFQYEYPCHGPDEKRWFLMWASTFEEFNNKYIVVAHINITDRIKKEKEIERKNEQLEILNRILRHDIRNDINVIDLYIDNIKEEYNQKELQKSFLKDIQKIENRNQHIIDLTMISKDLTETITVGGDFDIEKINLKNMLKQEIENTKSSYNNIDIEIKTKIPDIDVKANKMLSSVFRNILNNAIQHNDKETPKIEVSTKQKPDSVTISIADNGPGIPDDIKEKIFGKGEKSLKSEGTGIGLYLVDKLIEGYKGDVWIEDNKPEGTIFKIKLRKYN